MHLYLAAVYTNDYRRGQKQFAHFTERECAVSDAIPNILESYHYVNRQRYVEDMRRNGGKVFLDSGAFSAHSLGVSIDIRAYCAYIQKNIDIIRHDDGVCMASVLDGIGDPLKTYQNQLAMEQLGAPPLPCFHFGEDERYLEWYVQRYPYITIGGMVGKNVKDLTQWLDGIWNKHLLDGAGKPRLKVHAFGITTERIMERYPWYSVDSSSWIQAASFGSVFTQRFGPIAVSSKSPSRHDYGRHLTTLSAVEREHVAAEFLSDGFDPARLAEVYQSRAAFNMLGYMRLNEQLNRHFEQAGGVLDCHKVQQLF